jgi:hypothetical protein
MYLWVFNRVQFQDCMNIVRKLTKLVRAETKWRNFGWSRSCWHRNCFVAPISTAQIYTTECLGNLMNTSIKLHMSTDRHDNSCYEVCIAAISKQRAVWLMEGSRNTNRFNLSTSRRNRDISVYSKIMFSYLHYCTVILVVAAKFCLLIIHYCHIHYRNYGMWNNGGEIWKVVRVFIER